MASTSQPGAGTATRPTPEGFFADTPLGFAVFERVRSILTAIGPIEVTTSKSQVAFRRRRGFAYLWKPRQYLGRGDVEVVLSIALGRRDRSERWKEVVHPAPAHWMHHLEIRDLGEIDDQVAGWLREAADRSG